MNLSETAASLLEKAADYRLKGDYLRAIHFYKKSASLRSRAFSVGETYARAVALLGLGDLFRVKGAFADARINYKKAIDAAEFLAKIPSFIPRDDDMGMTPEQIRFDALVGLALCDKASGRYKSAHRRLTALLREAMSRGDKEAEGFLLWHTGMLLRFMGYPRKALEFIRRAMRIFKSKNLKTSSYEGIGFCLCAMGGILRVLGRTHESLKSYSDAAKIFRRTKDAYGMAYSLCGQANALKTLGRWDDALGLYSRSEKIYNKTGDLSSLAFVYKGIAGCYDGLALGLEYMPENESDIKSGKMKHTISSPANAGKPHALSHAGFRKLSLKYYNLARKFFIISGDKRGLRLLESQKKLVDRL